MKIVCVDGWEGAGPGRAVAIPFEEKLWTEEQGILTDAR